MVYDVLVIGAGVSGLVCAKVIASAGKRVRVLERSRGVGGRCATRRVDGQPVDHGQVFLHGDSADFLAALRETPGVWREGWPLVVKGSGTPCQPVAFAPGSQRVAHVQGQSAFAKHLAAGLDVALETVATGFELGDEGIRVLARQRDADVAFTTRALVLAMAGPQGLALLGNSRLPAQVETARAILSMMPSVPCATVIALYPADAPRPAWDIWYPEASAALLLVAHDSAKRENPARLALVFQGRPAWSAACVGQGPETWGASLLDEAGKLLGRWAARPAQWQAHMWRHARASSACELVAPLALDLGAGRVLGLAGEVFARGGGVQAAWESGRHLAYRLLEELRR